MICSFKIICSSCGNSLFTPNTCNVVKRTCRLNCLSRCSGNILPNRKFSRSLYLNPELNGKDSLNRQHFVLQTIRPLCLWHRLLHESKNNSSDSSKPGSESYGISQETTNTDSIASTDTLKALTENIHTTSLESSLDKTTEHDSAFESRSSDMDQPSHHENYLMQMGQSSNNGNPSTDTDLLIKQMMVELREMKSLVNAYNEEALSKSYFQGLSKNMRENKLVVTIGHIDNKSKFRGYSLLRWGALLVAVVLVGGYVSRTFFQEELKQKISGEVADVASRTLEDKTVVLKANEVSRQVLKEILDDPLTQKIVGEFVQEILGQEVVQGAAVRLASYIVNNPHTIEQVSKLAATTLYSLIEQESTRTLLLNYVGQILLDPKTQDNCYRLLLGLARDDATKAMLADLFQRVMMTETIINQAVDLGKNVTSEVVSDIKFQEDASGAMWNSFKMMITPRWFS